MNNSFGKIHLYAGTQKSFKIGLRAGETLEIQADHK